MRPMNTIEMHLEKLGKDGEIYIICPDEVYADALMGCLERYNNIYPDAKIVWASGDYPRMLNTRWHKNKDQTVYCITNNTYLASHNKYILTHCDIDYAVSSSNDHVMYQARGFIQTMYEDEKKVTYEKPNS